MSERKFKCDACGGVYDAGQSDEESYEEAARLWGMTREECDAAPVVCDDCFQQMTSKYPPSHTYIEEERSTP